MVLHICPNSCNSMLPISWMMRLDSSLNFIVFFGFPRSSRTDFVREPFLSFRNTSWMCPILSSHFKVTSCAIPSILRSTLNSGSFSTVDSSHRSSFLERDDSGSFDLSRCLDPLSALFPLSAPVAWCEKTHSQRCLVAPAATIVTHS